MHGDHQKPLNIATCLSLSKIYGNKFELLCVVDLNEGVVEVEISLPSQYTEILSSAIAG